MLMPEWAASLRGYGCVCTMGRTWSAEPPGMKMMLRDLASRPEELSSFVGRSRELGELRELLRVRRAVTLCGAGGIGKTRLALRLLASVAGSFPDGAWFVELADVRQPEQVVGRVASVVAVDEEPRQPLLDTLAESLRYRRAILVLDNCEHLIDVCARMCQRLLASSPGLQLIVTSREPLRVAAEAIWHVPPLGLPPADATGLDELTSYDAMQLFAERAAAAVPGFALGPANVARVAAICRELDGLALAIELAAAWVRVLSVDQIAARLDRRLALLTSADRSVPARQQALRATFDWSFELLSVPEQVLLRRLSLFSGWSLSKAEQVCADKLLPTDQILDLLTALVDKSLVEVEPDALGEARYRMLATIRDYSGQCLARSGEAAALRQRRRAYNLRDGEESTAIGQAMVPASWSARIEVFKRFDLEQASQLEELSSCLVDRDAETGMRICTAMRPVWLVRGSFAEGAAWLDRFLELDEAASVPDAIRGPALVGRAQLALASGSEQAEQLALAGFERCSAAGSTFWSATALNLLTEIALQAGRLDEATSRNDEALRVARSAGDSWNTGYALGISATVAGLQGKLREAEQFGESALAVMSEINHPWGCARALLGLGDLARLRSDLDIAKERYLAALTILTEVNARPEIARCNAGLGRLAIDQGDLPAARRHLAESLQLSFASGSRIGMARGLEALARLALLERNPQTGVRLAGAVTTLRKQAQLPALPGARTQRFLDMAAELGGHVVARLWADGERMTPAAAVKLALGELAEDAADDPLAPSRQSAAAHVPASGLTAREREVVQLVADGKTNRAIAAELVISPATAARHVANILAKLGFSSRSQVAAWASSADAAVTTEPAPNNLPSLN